MEAGEGQDRFNSSSALDCIYVSNMALLLFPCRTSKWDSLLLQLPCHVRQA